MHSISLKLARCFAFVLSLASLSSIAAEQPPLDPKLEPLRPLLGKTWRGEFKGSTPDKPMVDVSRWERALNGKAVRMLHSINDGVYGGETLFMWDEEKQSVVYYYFTSAGFRTTGTLTSQDGKLITLETVSGSANGISEVRGTSEIRADGSFFVKTEYLKDGGWTPGREVTYKPDAKAEVVFK